MHGFPRGPEVKGFHSARCRMTQTSISFWRRKDEYVKPSLVPQVFLQLGHFSLLSFSSQFLESCTFWLHLSPPVHLPQKQSGSAPAETAQAEANFLVAKQETFHSPPDWPLSSVSPTEHPPCASISWIHWHSLFGISPLCLGAPFSPL